MRDLDSRAQGLMKNIDSLADDYLRKQKTLTEDQRKEQLVKIQNLFNKAKVHINVYLGKNICKCCFLGIW